MIAYGHFDFCHGFVLVCGMYGLTYSLHHPRGSGGGGGGGEEEKGGREREVWFVLFNDTWFQ